LKILLFVALLVCCLLAVRYFGRQAPPGTAESSNSKPGSVDVAHACAVLGLQADDFTQATVIAAHRRLMQHLHPDKGGSALLAQQLNDAKQVLLTNVR